VPSVVSDGVRLIVIVVAVAVASNPAPKFPVPTDCGFSSGVGAFVHATGVFENVSTNSGPTDVPAARLMVTVPLLSVLPAPNDTVVPAVAPEPTATVGVPPAVTRWAVDDEGKPVRVEPAAAVNDPPDGIVRFVAFVGAFRFSVPGPAIVSDCPVRIDQSVEVVDWIAEMPSVSRPSRALSMPDGLLIVAPGVLPGKAVVVSVPDVPVELDVAVITVRPSGSGPPVLVKVPAVPPLAVSVNVVVVPGFPTTIVNVVDETGPPLAIV
jgi:hypothetical protein